MRYGERLPDTPDARRLVTIIAQHMARIPAANTFQTIPAWLALYAPFYTKPETIELLDLIENSPTKWRAKELGFALKLKAADRHRLRITTIAPCDASPQELAQQSKERAKLAKRIARRLKGIKPREQYIEEITAIPKPWTQQGISRRTYFRRLKQRGTTSVQSSSTYGVDRPSANPDNSTDEPHDEPAAG